jgi:ElaB/YqjD/DUF883 family membrane-anchored ribosome-binding protein
MKGSPSMDKTNSNEKFEEALHLLNEAAKEKKEEIQNLLTDKYRHIQDAVQQVAVKNREAWTRTRRLAEDALGEGGEKLKEAASEIDERVHENPWPYIGGVAIGALLLGFILGGSSRNR